MHWVDRGQEPLELREIKSLYTQKWVDYYKQGNHRKPSDSRWREFHDDIRDRFSGACGYCEEFCKGEVDHFRPKTKYPERVYDWSNWIFACHDCNHEKGNKWPSYGYVDPCARSKRAHPENYFDFDVISGEIIPKKDLTDTQFRKAKTMIKHLRLNEIHHLKKRLARIKLMTMLYNEIPSLPEEDAAEWCLYLQKLCTRQHDISSLSKAVLKDLQPDCDF
jgi:uncharacterized protein (TIGR02646 family)